MKTKKSINKSFETAGPDVILMKVKSANATVNKVIINHFLLICKINFDGLCIDLKLVISSSECLQKQNIL